MLFWIRIRIQDSKMNADPAGSGSKLKLVDKFIKHTFAGTKAFLKDLKSGLFVNFGQYPCF